MQDLVKFQVPFEKCPGVEEIQFSFFILFLYKIYYLNIVTHYRILCNVSAMMIINKQYKVELECLK